MSTPPTLPNQPEADTLLESEYLRREAQQSRAALEQTMAELKQSLRTAADLKLWAEHHPWLAVGGAAAGGFAVGAAIAAVLSGNSAPVPSTNAQPADAAPRAPQQSTLGAALLGPLFELAKVAVQSTITSAMEGARQSAAQQQAPAEQARTEDDPASAASL